LSYRGISQADKIVGMARFVKKTEMTPKVTATLLQGMSHG